MNAIEKALNDLQAIQSEHMKLRSMIAAADDATIGMILESIGDFKYGESAEAFWARITAK